MDVNNNNTHKHQSSPLISPLQQQQYMRCECDVCTDNPYIYRDMGECSRCGSTDRHNHCVRGGIWYNHTTGEAVTLSGDRYASREHGCMICDDCGVITPVYHGAARRRIPEKRRKNE